MSEPANKIVPLNSITGVTVLPSAATARAWPEGSVTILPAAAADFVQISKEEAVALVSMAAAIDELSETLIATGRVIPNGTSVINLAARYDPLDVVHAAILAIKSERSARVTVQPPAQTISVPTIPTSEKFGDVGRSGEPATS